MPVATGFLDQNRLEEHFYVHRFEFGVATKEEYFAMAKAFLEADRSMNPDILECRRTNGDIVRLNAVTAEFAVMESSGIVKTYFKPMPARLAPPRWPKRNTHPYPTNLAYYQSECLK